MQPLWILLQEGASQVQEGIGAQALGILPRHWQGVHKVPVGRYLQPELLDVVFEDSVIKLVAIVSQEQDKALWVADIDPVDQLRHVRGEGRASLHFLPHLKEEEQK